MNEEGLIDRRDPHRLPCADHETRVRLMEQTIESLKQTSEAVSTKLDLILVQITKVAILEERHNNHALDISRAHDKISKLEKQHDDFATEVRDFIAEARGMAKMAHIIWGLLGATVITLLVKVLFFAAKSGMTP